MPFCQRAQLATTKPASARGYLLTACAARAEKSAPHADKPLLAGPEPPHGSSSATFADYVAVRVGRLRAVCEASHNGVLRTIFGASHTRRSRRAEHKGMARQLLKLRAK
jgi:hypothetical protein